jgi:hypothetical protein
MGHQKEQLGANIGILRETHHERAMPLRGGSAATVR